ncbi:FAD binding domain-containing protein [Fusarium mexicanum]|uniref:FAD binding domain-containing protein n=1 Tax=Fusarium mexicanum TaxID=751941 RepID=A0A8H5IW70_9HYPO|nr:FAD binding domain-containing protein [Fusarium mexicanum]
MPHRVLSGGYNRSVSSYYSGQEGELRPCCVFAPTRSSEVAQFVRKVTNNGSSGSPKCTIRSGGHSIWDSAANIAGGITVDTRAMNQVGLSSDRNSSHTGLENVANITKETNGPLPEGNSRTMDLMYLFQNGDSSLYTELFALWEEAARLLADLQIVYLLQPHAVTNGTNSLGPEPGGHEFVMAVLTTACSDREDDGKVQKALQVIMNNQIRVLQDEGLYISFKYFNYADKSQGPIASYGKAIKRRIQSVSQKYDPQGQFHWYINSSDTAGFWLA